MRVKRSSDRRARLLFLSNTHLNGLACINNELASFTNFQGSENIATLDMDATLIASGKERATGVEWAEVCFVPNAMGHSQKGPE